jgi:steroid delta-isomerase-like uncharacterized protein
MTSAHIEPSIREAREATVVAHLEAENRHDVAATLATFQTGSARTQLPGEVANGPDAVAASYEELFTALPDMHFDVEQGSLCHHDNRVICETRVRGTHLGPYRGLPATGRNVDLAIVAVFSFDGVELVSERAYFDRLEMFIQLGVARDPNRLSGRLSTVVNHPITIIRAAIRR